MDSEVPKETAGTLIVMSDGAQDQQSAEQKHSIMQQKLEESRRKKEDKIREMK